jgi:transcriptional/translational regulatory protein YebC/TACO1
MITTEPSSFSAVRDALEAKCYVFETAEVTMIPQNYQTLTDEKQLMQIEKLLDGLEENDDVIDVYHNWESDDEE